jgi:hypothetical protein
MMVFSKAKHISLNLSFEARRRLVSATFMPLLDYGDILYMNASA